MQQDIYTWVVTYQDESVLHEEEAAQGFASVDQGRVKSVSLLAQENHLAHCVDVPQGAQAICFRRRSIMLNLTDPDNAQFGQTVHCIGWKHDESAVYLFVLANGITLLTNDLQAV